MNKITDKLVQAEACVEMQGGMTSNLLTPGMTAEVVKGRAAVTHEVCKVVDISRYADRPYRHAGQVLLLCLDTFVKYVQDKKPADGCMDVFVGRNFARAVFNADGWGDNCADFDFEYTPEMVAWDDKNACWLSQEDFCDFLEDQQGVIKEPCGVELLDLVANFRQKQQVEFGRSYRGSDGQVCVSYQEKNTGATRDLSLPSEFTLHLPVLKGAEKMTTYEVKARLKVRVDKESHNLKLRYELVRLDVAKDNALRDVAGYLREKLSGVPVYEGRVCKTVRDAICGGC
ncbi:MAG: DUF2303 family protein [Akkermansia sp.]|nr:DUF2303 family protein [Akkermansia sp.]